MLSFRNARVVVVGDVMLDRFVYGKAKRLSPEAPVPVVLLSDRQSMAGGAGNVARNIFALGGEVALLAVAGLDNDGEELAQHLGRANHIVRMLGRRTTVKMRVVAEGQQLVRVDDEEVIEISAVEQSSLLETLGRVLPGAGALVLSDYNKGVLTPAFCAAAIQLAHQHGVPCLVDPKGRDYSHYAGADVITPNASELALATGMPLSSLPEVEAAARTLLQNVPVKNILATLSERGMMLVPRDGAAVSEPAMAREVFDVSGAGDTAIATLALAVADGRPLHEAMRLANVAAGVVVAKLGTATCSVAELDHALREAEGATGEILPWDMATMLVREWQAAGLRVGFANGCFDILHAGHVQMLRSARRLCDKLIVAVNDDASVTRLKGPTRPVNGLADRGAVLAALAAVDGVVSFPQDTPLELITTLRPDVLFKGQDYTIDKVVGASEIESWGGKVELLELLAGRSTTNIISRATTGLAQG